MKILPLSLLVFLALETNGQTDMVSDAIGKDNIVLFREHCSRGDYQRAFYSNVQQESLNITKYLIRPKVAINEKDYTGSTALIAAIKNNRNDITNILLKNGANPNLPEERGLKATALMYAAASNDAAVVSGLINSGAEINDRDINGDPAINWATFNGNIDIMRLLIQRGADLEIKSKHGMAVDVAFRLWHADSVAEIFREVVFGKKLTKSEKELTQVVKTEDLLSIKTLLNNNTSPKMVDELGTPLIHLATEKGNQELIELLFAMEADLNKLNRVGQSALSIAARFGHLSLVDYYLES
ncbi:MAG: ankyrin repeat domain-containing protein [Cyclobacteriaceae bacterium]